MKQVLVLIYKALLTSFMFLALNSCGSMSSTNIESMDRSLVNSDIMKMEQLSELSSISPHTRLKSRGGSASGGCSVCAH